MSEEWKPIIGYENLYLISNKGRVKALEKYYKCNNEGIKFREEGILKAGRSNNHYLQVVLSNKGISKNKRIHRLVAEHFIPNPENKSVVNHKNGIKTDNNVENLEWVTKRENEKHAQYNNLLATEFKNSMTKVSNSDVLKIRELRKKGYLLKDLSRIFNISKSHISSIINNKKRTHV